MSRDTLNKYLCYSLLAFVLFFVFLLAFRKISDFDVWFHLATGRYIIDNMTIPKTDVFSHSAFGHPWITQEWLFGVIVYLSYLAGGFPGVVMMKAALVTATFAIIAVFLYKKGVTVHIIAPLILIASILTKGRFIERPELFSYIFIAVYVCVLESLRAGKSFSSRRLWALPAIMFFWTDIHAGAIYGLILIGIYLFGAVLDLIFSYFRRKRADAKDAVRTRIKPLILIFIITFTAGLLNPNTYRVYLLPFIVMDIINKTGVEIMEFLHPAWNIEYLFFISLFLSAVILILNIRKANITHMGLFIFFSYSAYKFRRNIAPWTIIMAPVIGTYIESSKNNILNRIKIQAPAFILNEAAPAIVSFSLIAMFAFIFTASMAKDGLWGTGVFYDKFPEKAVQFIEKAGIGGNMFNTYDFGGYIMWRTYPGRKVYIDGRLDVYPEVLNDEMTLAPYGFENLAKKYAIDYAIIDYKEGNEDYINSDPFFQNKLALVYWDDVVMVYVKRTPENARIIENYEYKFVRPMDIRLRLADAGTAYGLISEIKRNIKEDPSGKRNYILLRNACATFKARGCEGPGF